MFSYLGSKSKIIKLYPKPENDLIIEPFAGSARYSLEYFEKDVKLFDNNQLIVDIWNYLISASEKDILNLPDIDSHVSIDNYYYLTPTEKALIGFNLARGKAKPRKIGHGQNNWNQNKIKIASQLYKIRHWKIEYSDYQNINNELATWFIDPPYKDTQIKSNSDRYPTGDGIDYEYLGNWCINRNGQVIVCEGGTANYLPFILLKTINTNTNGKMTKKFNELIFHLNNNKK